MGKVKVAFKNVMDKRATYKVVEGEYLSLAVNEYARLHCEEKDLYDKVMHEKVTLRVNGKVIPVDDWNVTELVDDDKVLITPTLEAGKTGGIMGIIIGAIIIVASIYFPL